MTKTTIAKLFGVIIHVNLLLIIAKWILVNEILSLVSFSAAVSCVVFGNNCFCYNEIMCTIRKLSCIHLICDNFPQLLHARRPLLSLLTRRLNTQYESDSEKWLRLTSDTESGFSSAFEDDEGNLIIARGKLTHSRALKSKKPVSTTIRETSFIDWKRVRFRAGNGGDGCISFLHLINCHNAGPDGGDGGNGGHVVLKASSQVKSLANVPKLCFAERGAHGMGKDMTGASGEHEMVEVPIGTLVRRPTDNVIVADLDREHCMFIAARGGAGGKGKIDG